MSLGALSQAIPTSPERKCNIRCPKLDSWTFFRVSFSRSEPPPLFPSQVVLTPPTHPHYSDQTFTPTTSDQPTSKSQ